MGPERSRDRAGDRPGPLPGTRGAGQSEGRRTTPRHPRRRLGRGSLAGTALVAAFALHEQHEGVANGAGRHGHNGPHRMPAASRHCRARPGEDQVLTALSGRSSRSKNPKKPSWSGPTWWIVTWSNPASSKERMAAAWAWGSGPQTTTLATSSSR